MDEGLVLDGSRPGAGWIDDLPDGVVVCAADGTITLANLRLCEMAGYAREELVGMKIDLLVPAPSRPSHPSLRDSFVAEGRARPMGHPGSHLRLARRDGVEVPVEISLSPITGEGDRGVIAIVRDVAERRRVEASLRVADELLSLALERERIARDLHDTVLQRLFGLGLELEAVSLRAHPDIAGRLSEFVDDIDVIIREIRTAVFTLGAASREGFGQELSTVVSQAKRVLGFAPRLRLDGPVETATTPEIRTELLASLREALANVARHSGGTEAEIEVRADERLTLRVLDNGVGPLAGFDTSAGNGLRNMAERARRLGGDCALSRRSDRSRATATNRGSELRWWVPLGD